MKSTPDATNKEEIARDIVVLLKQAGFEAYWVGGCVRNMLLGRKPEDFDVATSAPPDEIRKLFPRCLDVGAKFGVVIILKDGIPTEVATFRKDDVYIDHRHPSRVHYSTAREDAERRDFTINALFYDPVEQKVIDFVGGKQDIKKRLIRGIGDPEQRFQEDALRMLRAIRFATRFEFKIEKNTWNAIIKNARLINAISPDRIREELIKIFTQPRARDALELMFDSGLLYQVLPEVAEMKGVPQPEAFHPEGDVFEHIVRGMDMLESPSPTLAFGFLLHDIGKPKTFRVEGRIRFDSHDKFGAEMASQICRRLNFSKAQREWIVSLVDRHMQFLNVQNMRQSRLKRFLSAPTIEEDLELHRIDCLVSNGDLDNYDFCREKLEEFKKEAKQIIPPPLITGADLIELGYKPGPLFGQILRAVEEKQLEGELTSKDQAIEFVHNTFPKN